jgi:hypothetical protein
VREPSKWETYATRSKEGECRSASVGAARRRAEER